VWANPENTDFVFPILASMARRFPILDSVECAENPTENPTLFYKILGQGMTHRGFVYTEGLNVLKEPFNPSGCCQGGGLYFSDLYHITEFLNFGDLIARVTLPPDARVYPEPCGGKWKADRIILSNIQPLKDFAFWIAPVFCLQAVRRNGNALQYAKHQTEEICLAAVQHNGHALQYVKNQTEAICLAAVRNSGFALQYVKNQTEAICLAAVQCNVEALKYVKEQTPAICLAAVRQNGVSALEFVKEQTPEICLAAVRQNGCAIKYVQEQTPEIWLAAVRQNGRVIQQFENPTEEMCLAAVQQHGMNLRLIKNPTVDVCLAAVQKKKKALVFVKNPEHVLLVKAALNWT